MAYYEIAIGTEESRAIGTDLISVPVYEEDGALEAAASGLYHPSVRKELGDYKGKLFITATLEM